MSVNNILYKLKVTNNYKNIDIPLYMYVRLIVTNCV